MFGRVSYNNDINNIYYYRILPRARAAEHPPGTVAERKIKTQGVFFFFFLTGHISVVKDRRVAAPEPRRRVRRTHPLAALLSARAFASAFRRPVATDVGNVVRNFTRKSMATVIAI